MLTPRAPAGSLFQAVEAGELDEVLRLLPACESFLRAGALGPEADTCVHLACLFKHESIFDALVDAGATLRAKDDNEGTVLHDAAASGALSIVTKLLSLAPDLANAVDSDDETALHCAARGGHLEIVAALLRAGTDKSVRNTFGQTALDCVDGEDTDTARVLADD